MARLAGHCWLGLVPPVSSLVQGESYIMNLGSKLRSGVPRAAADHSHSGLPAHSRRSCPEWGPQIAGSPAFALASHLGMSLVGKGCYAAGSAGGLPLESGAGPPAAGGGRGPCFLRPHRHVRAAVSRIAHPEPGGQGQGPGWGYNEQKGPLECPCLPGLGEGRSS